MNVSARWPDALLDAARFVGDPVGDAVVSEIARVHGVARVGQMLGELGRNDEMPDYNGTPLADTIERYLETTGVLPPWADQAQIALAERLFLDHGVMTVLALFCGSLPETYVNASEAAVMQLSGQLVDHAEHRIRATAAMIFPVMDSGGLGPDGRGIRAIQKVRLIHATIRHLILKGDSAHTMPPGYGQHLASVTWDPARGVPINQEELAYTLLTFSYVYVECWRKLGIRLTTAEQDAFIHCWDVTAHILGVRRDLMTNSFAGAAELFAIIQARTAAASPDGRSLARALEAVQEKYVPLSVLKPIGPLFSRLLVERTTATMLAIGNDVPFISRVIFATVVAIMRACEFLLRLFGSPWSPVTFFAEMLARRYLHGLLMEQTRPLVLPTRLLSAWAVPQAGPKPGPKPGPSRTAHV